MLFSSGVSTLTLCLMALDLTSGFPHIIALSEEDKLVKKLLAKYNRKGTLGRPLINYSDVIIIYYNMQLTQIMDLDEKNQILTLNVWDKYRWTDTYLKWDPSEHGNVTSIRIPAEKIWIPDIKLYNYADDRLAERRDALCVIEYDGSVLWMPQAIYKSSCEIDVSSFPFDIQKCHLKFGSWTYNGKLLDMMLLSKDSKDSGQTNGTIDLDEYVDSNSWIMLHTRAIRHERFYTCCPGVPFIDLSFTIIFQRRATLYNYILIIPCVLLTSLTLVLFWIPPESPAKLMLGINIFVAFFLLLLVMESNLPPAAAKVPLLGTYYCLNMVLITLSSFLNAFVVNLSFYGARQQLPKYLRMVMFEFFAKMLCMDSLVSPFKDKAVCEVASRLDRDRVPFLGRPMTGDKSSKWVRSTPKRASGESMLLSVNQIEYDQQFIIFQLMNGQLSDIVDFMTAYRTRTTDKDRKERVAKEWKAVSLIFDRIFFIVYLFTIVTSLCVMMPFITYPDVDMDVT